ncbi:cupin domain-containing protein [Halobacteriales archaeon QH_10_67_13]|nr:MAG: cupin domain-containing protein [Halobacteriales archaeon QH_10_67_13]
MDSQAPADTETAEVLDGVYLTQLAAGERTSVQRFHIEPGATVGEHSHDNEQAGYVVDGTLTLIVDGENVLAPDEPHAAANNGEVPVDGVEVFSPPRVSPPWSED